MAYQEAAADSPPSNSTTAPEKSCETRGQGSDTLWSLISLYPRTSLDACICLETHSGENRLDPATDFRFSTDVLSECNVIHQSSQTDNSLYADGSIFGPYHSSRGSRARPSFLVAQKSARHRNLSVCSPCPTSE